MRVVKGLIASLAGGFLVMGAVQSVKADSITVTIGTPVVTPLGNGTYEWAYGTSLSAGSEIQAGNFFEIIDFGKALSILPSSNWTATQQDYSLVPGAATQLAFNNLPADTARPNVLFQYNGPRVGAAFSSTNLGVFKLISTENTPTDGAIIGNDHQYSVGTIGRSQTNFGPTAVPAPLPAAAWGGMALIGLLGAARVRKALK